MFAQEQVLKALRPVRIALVCLAGLVICYCVLTIRLFRNIVVGIGSGNMLRAVLGALALCAVAYMLSHRPVFVKRQPLCMCPLAGLMVVGIMPDSARLYSHARASLCHVQ